MQRSLRDFELDTLRVKYKFEIKEIPEADL